MLRLFRFIALFSSFLLSLILISCSSENSITAPTSDKSAVLEKVVVTTPIHINHVRDTVITLPKSKIQVAVNKNYPTDNLTTMDAYYTAHSLASLSSSPSITGGIKPDYQYCPYHIDTIIVFYDAYQPAPGKCMGTWTDIVNPSFAANWGFNQYITGSQSIATEAVSYFGRYNVGLVLPSTQSSDVQAALNIIQTGPAVGFYIIDEPIEKNAFGGNGVNIIVQQIAPTIQARGQALGLTLTSYTPTTSYCAWRTPTGGTLRDQIAQYFPNMVRIVCDQYNGNCCGDVKWFYSDYNGFYGNTLNPTNLMDVLINNGSGNGTLDCPPYNTSTDFGQLLDKLAVDGDNIAWLYASASTGGTSQDVINYIANWAYPHYWVVRNFAYVVQTWQNTDGTCHWGTGQWSLINSYILSYGWAYY